MKQILAIVFSMCLILSCSSPESDGEKAAKAMIESQNTYVEERTKAYTDLIQNFDSYKFKTRVEVRERINSIEQNAEERFAKNKKDAEKKYRDLLNSYVTNKQEASDFQYAYSAYLKNNPEEKEDIESLKKQLNSLIFTIIPEKPTVKKIKNDLVGRKITDQADGYFGSSWRWTIEEGEVKEVKVLDEEDLSESLKLNVSIILQAKGAEYEAMANIFYNLGLKDDWTIETIESLSVGVFKSGKYDSSISCRITGIRYEQSLEITNHCDEDLIVGGRIKNESNGTWKKFSAVVKGGSTASVGCWFFFSVSDYIIDFVEMK